MALIGPRDPPTEPLYEFEQALGVGAGQGNLVCWGLWGHKQ